MIAVSRLWVARTLLSTVYRLVFSDRIEYGAARCSAKCTTASGRSSARMRGQPVVLRRQVDADEPDLAPGDLPPRPQPLPDRHDRRQRFDLQVDVDLPAGQVVQNGDIMTTVRQVQRRRPATETITPEYEDAHYDSYRISSESCAVTLPLVKSLRHANRCSPRPEPDGRLLLPGSVAGSDGRRGGGEGRTARIGDKNHDRFYPVSEPVEPSRPRSWRPGSAARRRPPPAASSHRRSGACRTRAR